MMKIRKHTLLAISALVLIACKGEDKQGHVVPESEPSPFMAKILDSTRKGYTQYFTLESISSITKSLPTTVVTVTSVPKPIGSGFSFSDISFYRNGAGVWVMQNDTPQPISELVVSVDHSNLLVLKFNSLVPAFSHVTLDFPTQTVSSLNYEHQEGLFLPTVYTDGYHADCSDVTTWCADDLNETERHSYLIMLANVKDSYNRRSFFDSMQSYFSEHCGRWSECDLYTNSSVSYATLMLLQTGIEGHTLQLKSLRNSDNSSFAGKGAGVVPLITSSFSNRAGWMGIVERWTTPQPSLQKTFYHEVGHAYGKSHDSGMSYGFPDIWAFEYLEATWTNDEITSIKKRPLTSIAMKAKRLEKERYLLEVNKTSMYDDGVVQLELINVEDAGYTLKTTILPNTFELTFNKRIATPTYIRAVSSNSDLVSTIKITPEDIYRYVTISTQDKLNGFNHNIENLLAMYDEIYVVTQDGKWVKDFTLPSNGITAGKLVKFTSSASINSYIEHDGVFTTLSKETELIFTFNGSSWSLL